MESSDKMFSAILILGVTALCVPLPATRLRCEGSSWGDNHPSYSYAIRHDRELTFTWSPEHTQERVKQQSYVLKISDNIREVVYDSGIIKSSIPVHTTVVSNLKSGMTYEWELMWSDGVEFSNKAIGQFHTGLSDVDWTGVPWIGSNDTNLFRSKFSTKSATKIKSAILYLSGLGYSHTTINGKDVSNSVLVSSPWTNYARLVGYSTYDVTNIINLEADNVIGIELGYGWRDESVYKSKEPVPGDNTERCFRTIIEYELQDGTSSRQNLSWSQFMGPVISDSVYNGETYDSRKEQSGWDTGYYNKSWPKATPVNGPVGAMTPWSAPQISISRVVKPINITTPKPGYKVVDFGINQAGVVRIRDISMKSGESIVLKFAEILQHVGIPGITVEPGMIYQGNLRGAKATDTYIGNGESNKTFTAKFTYHGFRYVEVTGSWIPTLDNIEMLHFHSAVPAKTQLKFSSPIINGIQKLAMGAQRSNMMSVLTDCDQRDERLGWMGDAALSAETISLNYDANSFLKFALDMQSVEVDSDGSLPDIVPWVRGGSRPGDVSWTLAYPEEIHANLMINNDTVTAKLNFNNMLRHQENIVSQAKSAGSLGNMKTIYGDWVPPPRVKGSSRTAVKPTSSYTSAFSYLTITRMVGEVAAAIGNQSVASSMAAQLDSLKKQFNDAFYKNGIYDKNIDTDNSLAIVLGVAGNTTGQHLVDVIRNDTHHFYAGIIGFKFLFDALYDFGYQQDALAILEATDYPSIGFMITNTMEPATSNVWELIDGPYEGPGMNSRNHHMFSSYSSYLVRKLAGIDVLYETGVVSLFPAPHIDLSSSAATMQLPNGVVTHNWTKEGGIQCAKGFRGERSHPDANSLILSCGSEGVIEEILFASYGQPSGVQCGEYVQHSTCHHSRSVEVTEKKCLGRNECEVDLKEFLELECGDHMRAAVRCSNERKVLVSATIPIGTVAKIHIPQGTVLKGSDGKLFDGTSIELESGTSHFTLNDSH